MKIILCKGGDRRYFLLFANIDRFLVTNILICFVASSLKDADRELRTGDNNIFGIRGVSLPRSKYISHGLNVAPRPNYVWQ